MGSLEALDATEALDARTDRKKGGVEKWTIFEARSMYAVTSVSTTRRVTY